MSYPLLPQTRNGDRQFLEWVRLKAMLQDLYDYLADFPTNGRLNYKWRRVAVAREICRREQ